MDYTIYTVSPPNYPHIRCFEELSMGLAAGLRELGHKAKETAVLSEIEGRAIVLGAHLIPHYSALPALPDNAIIYNTEVPEAPGWHQPEYLALLQKYTVWDYSEHNIKNWKRHGITPIYCGLGYHECLKRIESIENPDIDVVFYGSINKRRAKVLQEMLDAGIKLHVAPIGTYGSERDALIARSKIVLNIHYYDNAPLEMVRLSYLYANRKCVLTEGAPPYPQLFDNRHLPLAEQCKRLLKNPILREEIEKMDFLYFSNVRQSDYLRSALAATASLAQPAFHQPQSAYGE